MYHCKLNIFGFWTFGQTKQDIWRHHLNLWEFVMGIVSHCFNLDYSKTRISRLYMMKLIVSCSLTDHVYCVFAVFWLRSTTMCWAGSLQLWSSIRRLWCPVFPSSTCVTWPWWWDLLDINEFIFYFHDALCWWNLKKRICCENRLRCV